MVRRTVDCGLRIAGAYLLLGAALAAAQGTDQANQWGQWRGPLATGFAAHADPPVEWSETKNVRWKTALPGRGHSSPIVWEDHVYLTTAVPIGEPGPPRYDDAPGAHDSVPVTQR